MQLAIQILHFVDQNSPLTNLKIKNTEEKITKS